MAKLNERLKELRLAFELSQAELARMTKISKSSINMYERGEREPGIDRMEVFADFFNVDMDYLYGRTDIKNAYKYLQAQSSNTNFFDIKNIIPMPQMKKIPLLGDIACSEPILAQENIDRDIDIPANINADFALRCKGDSMINARILNGDVVYIKQHPDVNNGEIAAVLVDDEATLKRVYKYPDKIILQAENTAFPPIVYMLNEANNIRILGKAVGFTSEVR